MHDTFQYLLLLVFLTGHLAFENNLEGHLKRIHQITTHEAESGCLKNQFELVPIAFNTKQYNSDRELAELAANLIEDTNGLNNPELILSTLRNLLSTAASQNTNIDEARVVSLEPFWCTYGQKTAKVPPLSGAKI